MCEVIKEDLNSLNQCMAYICINKRAPPKIIVDELRAL